jgi:hypothetical protein
MINALIGGSLVAGVVWCWAKLVAPWAATLGLREELLEIQRELVVPAKSGESQYAEGLANLASMTSSEFAEEERDAVTAQEWK